VKAQLLGCTGPASGKRFAFDDVARIGRDGTNEIAIGAPSLARLHATITFAGGTFWVEDAGSPGGTYLNTRRITKERLYHLDVLSFGPEVELVFLARAPAETGPREGLVEARLLALDGPEAGSVFEIPKGTFTVGRATACNLVIESAAVSKAHARFERTNAYLTVSDLGSANGTFVNGVRITIVPLANGDRVLFAAAREFRVKLETGVLSASEASAINLGIPPAGESRVGDEQIQEMASIWKSKYEFTPGGDIAEKAPPAPKPQPAAQKPAPAPPTEVVSPEAPKIAAVVLTGAMGTFTLGEGRHVVGRAETGAIVLESTKSSRQHAAIDVAPGGATVTDLGSANGTFVNGQRLAAPHRLKTGETVMFGDVPFAVSLRLS
jgi:pSer/pThr/pTyr-binding forkhead associated (FHA) protein